MTPVVVEGHVEALGRGVVTANSVSLAITVQLALNGTGDGKLVIYAPKEVASQFLPGTPISLTLTPRHEEIRP